MKGKSQKKKCNSKNYLILHKIVFKRMKASKKKEDKIETKI
jgi:hypothetical protein